MLLVLSIFLIDISRPLPGTAASTDGTHHQLGSALLTIDIPCIQSMSTLSCANAHRHLNIAHVTMKFCSATFVKIDSLFSTPITYNLTFTKFSSSPFSRHLAHIAVQGLHNSELAIRIDCKVLPGLYEWMHPSRIMRLTANVQHRTGISKTYLQRQNTK